MKLQTRKRLFDIAFVVLFSPILSITILMIGFLVGINMGRPVFFRQYRPGLKGKPFWLWKFRTMKEIKNEAGENFPDQERITKLGKWLRESSLDEWPEFINVFKGDMSLVGPRPLLMEYLGRFSREQMRRHEVKPGMTGWAQINGRNAVSWEERFKLDVWYVDHASLTLDMKIICLTLWKVMKREGISHPGEATMTKFLGGGRES